MTDNHTPKVRSYNMSRIRSKDTKSEILVRKYLFSKGFRYRKNDNRYPGKPDIVLPRYKTAILINGCFWHMHANCPEFVMPKSNIMYWEEKLRKNQLNDYKNVKALEDNGWKVIILWECELSKDRFENRMEQLVTEITCQKSI